MHKNSCGPGTHRRPIFSDADGLCDPNQSFIETVIAPPAFFTAIHPTDHLNVTVAFAFSAPSLSFALAIVDDSAVFLHTGLFLFLVVFHFMPLAPARS
jgi:hypothetical protein